MEIPLEKWTVTQLKTELKTRNLLQTGIKSELIERLQKAMSEEDHETGTEQPVDNETDVFGEANGEDVELEGQDADHVDIEAEIPAENEENTEEPEAVKEGEAGNEEKGATQMADPLGIPEPEAPLEWQVSEIPDEWLPQPLIQVKNVPADKSADDVRALFDSVGLATKSVHLDENVKGLAYVRFPPPSLPWKLSEEDLKIPMFELPKTETGDLLDATEGKNGASADEVAEKEGEKPKSDGSILKELKAEVPDGRKEGDVYVMAKYYAHKLSLHTPSLQLGDAKISFDGNLTSTTLYLGNIMDDDEEKLRNDLAQYGPIIRCFIVRNSAKLSKEYGFVEFAIPSHASKAKESIEAQSAAVIQKRGEMMRARFAALKKIETKSAEEITVKKESELKNDGAEKQSEEADAKMEEKKEETVVSDAEATKTEKHVVNVSKEMETDQTDSHAKTEEIEGQVKIMRADFCPTRTISALYSQNLYVANLKKGFADEKLLYEIFSEFGMLSSCYIATHPQTGAPKNFAFVAYKRSDHADLAFRAMDGADHPVLGKLMVSFINPIKHDRRPATNRNSNQFQQGGMLPRGGRSFPGRGLISPGRGGRYGGRGGAPFMGRGSPARGFGRGPGFMGAQGRGMMGPPGGMPGRGAGYNHAFEAEAQAAMLMQAQQQERMQMQQIQQMQAMQAMQLQRQQQMAAQQLQAMQNQTRQAQQQLQQYQERLAKIQQETAEAQAKAKEAEKRRIEAAAAARRTTQNNAQNYPAAAVASNAAGSGVGTGGYGSGYQGAYNQGTNGTDYGSGYGTQGYGNQSGGGYGTATQEAQGQGQQASYGSQGGGYGSQAQTGTGYQSSQQGSGYGTGAASGGGYGTGSGVGYGSSSGTGYGTGSGAGYGTGSAAGYGTGSAAGYGTGSTGYGTSGTGYGASGAGYGSSGAGTGYNATETGYGTQSSTGYGTQGGSGYGSETGYGTTAGAGAQQQPSYGQSGAGYSQQSTGYGIGYGQQSQAAGYGAGQKRDADYSSGGGYAKQEGGLGYGGYGGAQDPKRSRY